MKHASIALTLFLAATLFSCAPNKPQPTSMVLEGTLPKWSGKTLYLAKSSDVQDYRYYVQAVDSVVVDSTGQFQFSAAVTEADFYQIKRVSGYDLFSGKLFYLGPDDTLQLQVSEETSAVALTGNASAIHQFQWDFHDQFLKDRKEREEVVQEAPDYLNMLDTRKSEQLQFIEAYAAKASFPDAYKHYFLADINYRCANDYFYYLKYHHLFANQDWKYIPSDSLPYAFMELFNINDPAFTFNLNRHTTIKGLLEDAYQAIATSRPDSARWVLEFTDKLEIAENNFTGVNQEIALKNLSREFGMFLLGDKENFYDNAAAAKERFAASKSSDLYYALYAKSYEDFLKIAPGQPAPVFTLPDSTGQLISLADFKGKIVYLDFWGTWCGPCVAEIPTSKDLQEKYKDNDNVVFLFIAMESKEKNIAEWKALVQEKEFPGVHVVAKNQMRNKEIADYQISFAPTHFLINHRGEIVDPRAPRSKDIQPLLEELLAALAAEQVH